MSINSTKVWYGEHPEIITLPFISLPSCNITFETLDESSLFNEISLTATFVWISAPNSFAADAIEFEKIFYNAMQSPRISDHIMEKRKELYLQCFDDLTGDAIGKYTKTIINVIEQNRRN